MTTQALLHPPQWAAVHAALSCAHRLQCIVRLAAVGGTGMVDDAAERRCGREPSRRAMTMRRRKQAHGKRLSTSWSWPALAPCYHCPALLGNDAHAIRSCPMLVGRCNQQCTAGHSPAGRSSPALQGAGHREPLVRVAQVDCLHLFPGTKRDTARTRSCFACSCCQLV